MQYSVRSGHFKSLSSSFFVRSKLTVRVIIQISKPFASLISIYFVGDFPTPPN
jgi:hypothetical protein